MATISAPTFLVTQEEWPDADFDLPDGQPIIAPSQSDGEDEDWDAGLDVDRTRGTRLSLISAASAPPIVATTTAFTGKVMRLGGSASRATKTESWDDVDMPAKPLQLTSRDPTPDLDWDDDEDEGASTIKLKTLPAIPPKASAPTSLPLPTPQEVDNEDDFDLPADLSHLSLRPLHHRPSKVTLDGWGDHTGSSTTYSSETSSIGFGAYTSPSSAGTSTSQPETETDEDDGDAFEGLVLPDGLFDSGKGGRELNRILENKKRLPALEGRVKVASPDAEDFENGLVIDGDADFSPSRLRIHRGLPPNNRSKSMPTRSPPLRPSSRPKGEFSRTTTAPLPSTNRPRSPLMLRPQIQSQRASSPTPPPRLKHSPTLASLTTISSGQSTSTSTLAPKSPRNVKPQKSHSRLQPATTSASRHGLTRKASLSSLFESSSKPLLPSPQLLPSPSIANLGSRYESSTVASRARSAASGGFFQTSSRVHAVEHVVPPTRPSTPSANPAALRLTMPTSSSRLKARPSISNVFPAAHAQSPSSVSSVSKSPSPPPYPPSQSFSRTKATSPSPRSSVSTSQLSAAAPKILRKPKRARAYGDGTELDGFDDLPTDRDKEGQFRAVPKGSTNSRTSRTAPDARTSRSSAASDGRTSRASSDRVGVGTTGTISRKSGKSILATEPPKPTPTLKHKPRIEFPAKPVNFSVPNVPSGSDSTSTRRRKGATPTASKRKPTLIRNLSGAGAPKVVGDMKWNPQTLRWEGNDSVLRDFDSALGSSTRPALITQLTGSSIGSPVSSLASGVRVVGSMMFDPVRMCWISRLPPEEEEPDVFADLADDEDEEDWETKGGTIRASVQPTALGPLLDAVKAGVIPPRDQAPSPSRSHTRSLSESGSEGMWALGEDDRELIDDRLWRACRAAEDRHRGEMRGWNAPMPRRASRSSVSSTTSRYSRTSGLSSVDEPEVDRAHLFELRVIASKFAS